MYFPFYNARYVGVEREICCAWGKKLRDYIFIPTCLFRDAIVMQSRFVSVVA